jgi:cytidylate kinase
MIFAVYGASCVGKTTVASRVAEDLKLPLRSCGSVVRDRAKALGIELHAVPDDVHHEIDRATVAWALANEPCVVEGRFLDKVLADVDAPIMFIQLTASESQRQFRGCNPGRTAITVEDLRQADMSDLRFRERMFPYPGTNVSCVTVDNSDMTVEGSVLRIKAIIEAELSRRG